MASRVPTGCRGANTLRSCTRELCQFAETQATLAGPQLVNYAPFMSFGPGRKVIQAIHAADSKCDVKLPGL